MAQPAPKLAPWDEFLTIVVQFKTKEWSDFCGLVNGTLKQKNFKTYDKKNNYRSLNTALWKLRTTLIKEGVIVDKGGWEFYAKRPNTNNERKSLEKLLEDPTKKRLLQRLLREEPEKQAV